MALFKKKNTFELILIEQNNQRMRRLFQIICGLNALIVNTSFIQKILVMRRFALIVVITFVLVLGND
ncbi:hypothetical protein EHR_14185 [Enterococcus hirae ATCC 9790]|uniref:Uncharacterized protein n=1 Tax=Enterococcus hirae (strain ATCC 9790 / DSM 20160 / JCM 8729 / LMG 6399 / NBRC 3181 / NCIMB 6459 / NCDO 1258 / NCTC 12367 / WDCM 00089 / R) TaxID=768486 RepID=I6TDZ2_ENTHA|nr:hypothetical protein EHR_14185 [Enterococcus hirae ATCC 9790]